jgi:hypothetical protein
LLENPYYWKIVTSSYWYFIGGNIHAKKIKDFPKHKKIITLLEDSISTSTVLPFSLPLLC